MNSEPVAPQASVSIEVVVAILMRNEQVLLCQRKKGSRYELRWEFPGGKVEAGESYKDALERELREELSLELGEARLLMQKQSDYSDGGRFSVSFFRVDSWRGEYVNNVFESVQWVDIDKVHSFDILEGNRELVAQLPSMLQSSPTHE